VSGSCLLLLQERRKNGHSGTSLSGQKQTKCHAAILLLLDHRVGE
jgi:hypothetical protein